ncbi:MAG: SUMF1/EgtB/PvdO family nonheme iron enzyme [Treponema sp.]|nr:SUMF1/EgtB/PvdO family nonheme iron enzyme [Candidatus Treponema equifaecale]
MDKTYADPVIFATQDLGEGKLLVIMLTTTDGGVIHYTMDGTVPTVESAVYVSPLSFDTDATIKAITIKTGVENSPVSVATVSIVEKKVTCTKYVCPSDGKEFDTAEEAEACCGPVEVVKYVCPKCEKTYNTAKAATDCCGVQTVEKEVTVYKYVCPKDKKEYTTAQEAADCCGVQIEYVDKEVEKIVKKYVCPRDGKEYDTAEEAADCCGVQTIEKEVTVYKYVCPKDKKEYATAREAADCCGVQIEYVDKEVEKIVKKYVCPRDGKEYDTAEEAEKLVYTSELASGTYTVYHFQQKTTGGKAVSDYVLESTENSKSVAAESTIANLKKTFTGFTEKAMAQNETAIYVFYDRNTITYTFQTGTEGKFEDGKTEKTVSGLYGASYTKPKAPTSGDYNFVRWQDSSENVAPSAFGAEDKTWTAVWKDKSEGGETIPEGFVEVAGVTITGDERWTPSSDVFVSGRKLTIPSLIVCDHEVTRGEFKTVMGTDPSTASAYDKDGNKLTGDAALNNPVNYVNWYAAIAYCNKLSIAEGLTPCYSVEGITDWTTLAYSAIPTSDNANWNNAACNFDADGYRLPTEAEWEWLARGGENYPYAGSDKVGDVAWYTTNTNDTGSREVKTKQKNGYDLYDMSGNVWEWCWDWYGSISSSSADAGAASGSGRCLRGGSWYSDGDGCRVALRYSNSPIYRGYHYGFRVCRTAK